MEDDWFNNDPFDSIVKQFFGESPIRQKRQSRQREDEEQELDLIETDGAYYIIIEVPGYTKDDINVQVKDKRLEIKATKENGEEMVDYLQDKLQKGMFIRQNLPPYISAKDFTLSCTNGILEIKFLKK